MAQTAKNGFLGRGPLFWMGMMFISTIAVAVLAISGAVENKGAIMILLVAPASLMIAVYKAAQNQPMDDNCVAKSTAQQRYIKRVAISTSLYLMTFALMTFLKDEVEVPLVAQYILAVLPGLAVCGIFWAVGRLIVEEEDEFLRMLTVRQTLIASALSLSAASVWGYLESADLVVHADAYWYAIIWFFGLGVGAVANRIQYGTWGAV
ncbi:hypothetical protein KCG46_03905 [Erythrobacter sp. WH158]|uniref:Uncharacterized protein n=2 Tax=Erythrobacter crassostreae TaxID=2828328 RepID=A0A9X1F237_9SPHN|nr:hypothetical protein [Erythrobacter crassostrea]